MNRYYRIYCTQEQTKKALELGAPIAQTDNRFDSEIFSPIYKDNDKWVYADIPTAEEMIGWLEEQEGINNIVVAKPSKWLFMIYDEVCYRSTGEGYSSRKEATLAAIDVALEYLSNNKK